MTRTRLTLDEGTRLTLDDGRCLCVRPLRASDRARYRDAVAALSPRSRYLRFAGPLPPQMTVSLLDRMMRLDRDRHVVYVGLTADERRIVGVARFVADATQPDRGEVAIAVADEWQRAGLGAALLAKIIEHARIAGLHSLIATMLIENVGAARLARSCGFSATGTDSGYRGYELPLRLAA
jgi:RimJ/RimL family protein N-acetyltransferase